MHRHLTLLLIVFSSHLFGQKRNFKPSASFGISASQVDGDAYGGFNKLGAVVGLGVNRQINTRFSWNLGIQVAQKGSYKGPNTKNGDFSQYRISLIYAEIPLSLAYRVEDFKFFLGASFGTLAYARESNENGEIRGNRDFKRFEYAGFWGVQYDFNKKYFLSLSTGSSLAAVRDLVDGPVLFDKRDGQYNLWIYTMLGIQIGR